MNQPSPFVGTEDFFKVAISDCVHTLSDSLLCSRLRKAVMDEHDMYWEALRGLEAAKEQDAKDWAPCGAKENEKE